jgi:hypothetical protein
VGDHLRECIGADLRQQRRESRLECVAGRVVLEPEEALPRRDPRDRGPRACPLDLDLTRALDLRVDPRRRTVEPVRLLPGEA